MLFELAFFTVLALVKRANDYAEENKRLANQLNCDAADFEREYQLKAATLQLQTSIQNKKESLFLADQKIDLLKQVADSWYQSYRQRKRDLKKIKANLKNISAISAKLHRDRTFFFIKKLFGLVKMTRAELDAQIQVMEYLVKNEKQRFQSCLSTMKREHVELKSANRKVKGMMTFRRNMKRSLNNARQSQSNVFRNPGRFPAPKTKQTELASEKSRRNTSTHEYQLVDIEWDAPSRTTMTLAEYKKSQKGIGGSPRFRLKP